MSKQVQMIHSTELWVKVNVLRAVGHELGECWLSAAGEKVTVMNLHATSLLTSSLAGEHFKKSCFLGSVIPYQAADLRLLECEVICRTVCLGIIFSESFHIYHTFIRVMKIDSPSKILFHAGELTKVDNDVEDYSNGCIDQEVENKGIDS